MSALTFNEIELIPVNHNNQIWLSASELAKALGYSRSDKVTQIYNRNKDEFADNMSAIILQPQIEVTVENKGIQREIRIFSPRGCHLIAMLSHTKIAKEFRRWVLDVLDKQTKQEKPPVPSAESLEEFLAAKNISLVDMSENLLIKKGEWTPADIESYKAIFEQHGFVLVDKQDVSTMRLSIAMLAKYIDIGGYQQSIDNNKANMI